MGTRLLYEAVCTLVTLSLSNYSHDSWRHLCPLSETACVAEVRGVPGQAAAQGGEEEHGRNHGL